MRVKLFVVVLLAACCGLAASAQTWERLGPDGGMVVSLGADARGHVYLGTADGHVFASADNALSWELRGRVGTRTDAVVTRLLPDPRNEKKVFASVWYQQAGAGGGVFESDDAGRSWKLLGLEKEAVRALEMAPSKAEQLVAGAPGGE